MDSNYLGIMSCLRNDQGAYSSPTTNTFILFEPKWLCTLAMVVATKSHTESLRSGTIQTKVRVSSIFLFYGDARFEFEGVLIPELVVPENNNDNILVHQGHTSSPSSVASNAGTPQAQSPVAVQASGSSHLRLFQEGRRLGGA
ncbi:hypothetical protein VPH35_037244 [Triticum aestivum]